VVQRSLGSFTTESRGSDASPSIRSIRLGFQYHERAGRCGGMRETDVNDSNVQRIGCLPSPAVELDVRPTMLTSQDANLGRGNAL